MPRAKKPKDATCDNALEDSSDATPAWDLEHDPDAPKPPEYQPGVIDDGAWWRWMDELRRYYEKKHAKQPKAPTKTAAKQ